MRTFDISLLTETINFLFFHLHLMHFICLSSPNLIELFIDRKRLSIGIRSFSSWMHTSTRTPSSYSNHNHHYHRMCMCGVSRMSCQSLHSSTVPSAIRVYMCVKLDWAILISFSYLSSHRERTRTRSTNAIILLIINVNDVSLDNKTENGGDESDIINDQDTTHGLANVSLNTCKYLQSDSTC